MDRKYSPPVYCPLLAMHLSELRIYDSKHCWKNPSVRVFSWFAAVLLMLGMVSKSFCNVGFKNQVTHGAKTGKIELKRMRHGF